MEQSQRYISVAMVKLGIIERDDRLVMLEDAVSINGINLVDNLKADRKHICKKRPVSCDKCSSNYIIGVEVMGSYDGILFWECDECENTILRFKADTTERYLQLAKGLWTNLNDWGYCPRSKFN